VENLGKGKLGQERMKTRESGEVFLYLLTIAVAIYFGLVFSGIFAGRVDFWSLLSGGLMVFLIVALWGDPLFSKLIYGDFREKPLAAVGLGVISAALLYLLFFVGNILLQKLFPSSLDNLVAIYNLKSGRSSLRIGLFLGLIIGPGEELLWRGWLQRHWSKRLGKIAGLIAVALLYSAVHLASGNPVLVLAALVGGLWWGYQYLRFNSLLSNVISHLLWDLVIFIALPFY